MVSPFTSFHSDDRTRCGCTRHRARVVEFRSSPAHNSVRSIVLGCVTELTQTQVDHGSGEVGKAPPTAARLIAAERAPGGVLEAGERVRDVVALGVDRLVPR